MANNVTLSAGTADGAVIATDDIGAVHYPYTKIGIGADDTFTILVGGAGAVAAGVQRVTLASDDPAVTDLAAIEVLLTTQAGYLDGIETLIGTTNTNTGNAATSLSVMDDWDNGASDGASVSGDVAHDAADAGEPVKIGGFAKAAAPTDVSADGDRVNAWFDLAGRLQIGDGGGSLTVDNAGLTELAAAINASSQVDVNLAASNATVTVDLGANNDVTVTNATAANLKAEVVGTGTFAVQVDGSALTALQKIDDPVFVDDAAFTPATSSVMMIGAEFDDTLPNSVDEGDAGAVRMSANRNLYVSLRDAAGNERGLNVDANGAIAITDGSGTITVDNAGLTELAAAINASSQVDVNIAASNASVAVTNAGITTIAGAVSGTEMQVDVLTSALPTGAATAAKQPALGTAGTASADVITVQGIASMTALKVDGSGVTQPVSNAGITTIAGAVSGTEMQVDVVAALPAGTNAIGKLAANSGVDIGDVDVTSISAGTNAIGNVGLIGRTTGGMSIFRSIDIDETEEEVKATAGQVFSIVAFNTTAAPLYLKFYNLTAANTTVGTSTPVLTFLVPGNADSDGAGFVWNNDIGWAFGTAISVACTTAIADNDTGAPGANACLINVGYV